MSTLRFTAGVGVSFVLAHTDYPWFCVRAGRYPAHSGRGPYPLSSVTRPCLDISAWVFVYASSGCSQICFSVLYALVIVWR